MGTRPWNGCPGPPTQPVQALANFVYFIILIITIITNVTTLLNTSAQPPEAAPVLGARPVFWPGQDPRFSQDQHGPPRPTEIKIINGTGKAILTAIGAPPRMVWPPEGMLRRSEGLPGDTFSSLPTASAPPPEAAPVLGARPAFWPGQDPRSSQDQPGPSRPTAIKIIIGTGEAILTAIGAPPRTLRPLPGNAPEAASVLGARPAFWPGQDPRSSQDQPGPPRPTAIKIIIGTGEAILTAIGAPPRARWLPLGRMQRAIPGPLISSRCLAPTRPPGPCTAV